jgi:septum formation protein
MRIARIVMATSSDFRLILASASPRRRELLTVLGWPFEVRVSGIDETPGADEAGVAYVQRVAREKAEASARAAEPRPVPEVIIAADTEVVFEGEVFGKPGNVEQATAMLKRLRGRTHEVISAITVRTEATGDVRSDLCRSDVPCATIPTKKLKLTLPAATRWIRPGLMPFSMRAFTRLSRSLTVMRV